MSSTVDLFSTARVGRHTIINRMVMAPMTRLRAVDSIPTDLMAEYYAQRSSAGLIVSECTMIAPTSQGYMGCPGIYTEAQMAGWRKVARAVHDKAGKIFLQLWHCGRVSHPALLEGALPIAPSAIAAAGSLHTPVGKVSLEAPRALETDEIPPIVEQFRQGALNAIASDFDGVELHGAFGYLIDQFLQDGSNQRTDRYGGSVENRARFLLEVVDAVCQAIGSDRVGIKLSPSNTYYGMKDSNPEATFGYAIGSLNQFDLAYIHLMEPAPKDLERGAKIDSVLSTFRSCYEGTIVTNGGYDKDGGNAAVASGMADVVSYGRPFIANPDLPRRYARDAELNEPDPSTFYGVGDENLEKGYTDYSFLSAEM